ncbi:MAG: HPr family phosphocarrier protein [Solirubrobacterales bacterium]
MNPDVPAQDGEEIKRSATIANRRGLHARAAAKFVKLAATFDAQITVAHRGTEVSGMSIMGLMMLAAAPGCCIELRARGPEAGPAIAALCDLIDQKFDED